MSAETGSGRRTVAVRTPSGSLLAGHVTVARGFGSRLVGLMGRRSIDPDEGLWLVPCNSVHMFFMRTPLDIAYLDRRQQVVLCVPEMREWRVRLLPVRHAHSALELAPGTLRRHRVTEGDQLSMETEPVVPTPAQAQAAPVPAALLSSSPRE